MKPYEFLRSLISLSFQEETNPMQPLFARTDRLSGEAIDVAVELRRTIERGLLERI
jgi:hypothetical protein